MSVDDAVTLAALLGPGFIALKVFYVYRAQPGRSQWEWTVWSVLAGFPIAWAVQAPASWLAPPLRLDPSTLDVLLRVGLAVLAGVIAGVGWERLMNSKGPRLEGWRRRLRDYAWDAIVEDVLRNNRYVVADTTDGMSYRGWIEYAAREDAKAEPWIYLTQVKVVGGEEPNPYEEPLHGVLLHRERINRIRVELASSPYPGPGEAREKSVVTDG